MISASALSISTWRASAVASLPEARRRAPDPVRHGETEVLAGVLEAVERLAREPLELEVLGERHVERDEVPALGRDGVARFPGALDEHVSGLRASRVSPPTRELDRAAGLERRRDLERRRS